MLNIIDDTSLEGLVYTINEALKQAKKKWEQVLSIRALYCDNLNMTSSVCSNILSTEILKHSKTIPTITSIPVNALGSLGNQVIVCALHVL